MVLGQEGSSVVFCFEFVLELNLVVLSGECVSLCVLLPSLVHDDKVIF